MFEMIYCFVEMISLGVKMTESRDQKLLALLRRNARTSVTELAKALHVSRSTIQNRIARLEASGVIRGYSVILGGDYLEGQVEAHVSIKVRQKLTARTNTELERISQVAQLFAVSGEYDLIAIVQARTLEELSKVLDDIGNLEGVERVFPFVATCGTELDAIQPGSQDMLAAYCFETIRLILVNTARRHAEQHLKDTYLLGQLSRMAPGSLDDWPLPQQAPLFDLLGDVTQRIGVTLSDRFLMVPVKSVSGIFFPTEVRFESCQLCQRVNCSGRRAPYDAELAARYGI